MSAVYSKNLQQTLDGVWDYSATEALFLDPFVREPTIFPWSFRT